MEISTFSASPFPHVRSMRGNASYWLRHYLSNCNLTVRRYSLNGARIQAGQRPKIRASTECVICSIPFRHAFLVLASADVVPTQNYETGKMRLPSMID